MTVHARREKLRKALAADPRSAIADLQELLGVSRATVRRDLIELEQQGEVVRVHGGVVASGLLRGEPTFDRRSTEQRGAKQAIARAAASRVKSGQTVYLDAGTTCVELARLLVLRDDVRLVTHSVPVLALAQGCPAEVICVGGTLRQASSALVGALTQAWLDELRVDIAFLGASGLSVADGASTTETTEADVKRQIIERADQAVLCADASKLGHPATVRFARWNAFAGLCIDELSAAAKRQLPRRLRVDVAD